MERALRVALGVVATVGLGVSGYLVAVRFQGQTLTCVVGGDCAIVQESAYAEVLGVPVALLGLAAYAGLLGAAVLPGAPGRSLGLFVGIVGAGFSVWLTWVELAIIDAICPWCVVSAALTLLALGLAAMRVVVTSPPAVEPYGSGER